MSEYDEVLVLRLLSGERGLLPRRGVACRAYRAEIDEVIRRAHSYGWTDAEIARRSGLSSQTALRVRRRLGLGPVPHPKTSRRYLREVS